MGQVNEKNILLCFSSIELAENEYLVPFSTFTGSVLTIPCLLIERELQYEGNKRP